MSNVVPINVCYHRCVEPSNIHVASCVQSTSETAHRVCDSKCGVFIFSKSLAVTIPSWFVPLHECVVKIKKKKRDRLVAFSFEASSESKGKTPTT